MRKDRRNPNTPQGLIKVTTVADKHKLHVRMKTSSGDSKGRYHGGSVADNQRILPGQILLGNKISRNKNKHLVVATLNGDRPGDLGGKEQYMRTMDFVGISETEYIYGSDTDHITCVQAGGFSFVNTGPNDILPGDLIAWDIPWDNQKGELIAESPQVLPRGLGPQQIPPQVRRFDPKDFRCNMQAILKTIMMNSSSEGISDLGLDALVRTNMTNLQEEAAGCKYATLTKVIAAVNYLVNEGVLSYGANIVNREDFATKIGFFDENSADANNLLQEIFKGCKMDPASRRLKIESNKVNLKNLLSNKERQKKEILDKMWLNVGSTEWGAYLSASTNKLSWIIGKCNNFAKARKGTCDAVIGYTKLC